MIQIRQHQTHHPPPIQMAPSYPNWNPWTLYERLLDKNTNPNGWRTTTWHNPTRITWIKELTTPKLIFNNPNRWVNGNQDQDSRESKIYKENLYLAYKYVVPPSLRSMNEYWICYLISSLWTSSFWKELSLISLSAGLSLLSLLSNFFEQYQLEIAGKPSWGISLRQERCHCQKLKENHSGKWTNHSSSRQNQSDTAGAFEPNP